MENEIVKMVATNGAFAALFVWLLFNTQKENAKREDNYQNTIKENQNTIKENQVIISQLAKNLEVVTEVKEDLEDIKNKLNR